jgi:hypothetical protein
MADDDLRFGDVSGGNGSSGGIIGIITNILIAVILIYVILNFAEIIFNLSIPFV